MTTQFQLAIPLLELATACAPLLYGLIKFAFKLRKKHDFKSRLKKEIRAEKTNCKAKEIRKDKEIIIGKLRIKIRVKKEIRISKQTDDPNNEKKHND